MKVNNFDIIVLGSNVSALIAAAFLCKSGYRILLVEESEDKKNTSPFFDDDATAFISGCAPNRLLYNIFRELSIPIHHQKKFRVKELSYQLALPDCRLDIGSSWNLYHQEIKREFHNDIEAIEHIYNEVFKCDKLLNEVFYNYLLYPQNLSSKLKSNFVMYLENIFKINEEKRSLSEIMLTDFKNDQFKDVLDLQINSLSSSSNDKSNMTTLFLLGTFQRGIAPEANKLSLLKRILKEQIALTHGEFIKVEGIDSIQASKRNPLKDKKGIILKFKGAKREVESKFMIFGQPLFFLPKILKGIRLSRNFKKLVKRFIPKSAKLTFTFKIDRWGIPIGFRSRVLYVSANTKKTYFRKSCDTNKIIMVSISPDYSDGANENSYLLKGTIQEPFHSGIIKAKRIKDLSDEVTSYLKELIPFYDNFVTPAKNCEFDDINLDNLHNGDFNYNSSFLKNLSLGEVHSSEVIKNIYFTGKEFLPQLGFEGEVISGWRTANVIINKFKLHKMF